MAGVSRPNRQRRYGFLAAEFVRILISPSEVSRLSLQKKQRPAVGLKLIIERKRDWQKMIGRKMAVFFAQSFFLP
jgi:hypothetical protein